jgi:predicted RNase H-related nuclease YkuK (DUF458 family)
MSESIIDRNWYDGSGNSVLDIVSTVEELSQDAEVKVRIGTDAQRIGLGIDFVTVIVVTKEMRGGRMFYTRTRANRPDMSLWEKLSMETWYSLETAMHLADYVPFGKDQMEVHADANPNQRWQSSNYVQQIAGMIVGQGFKAILKPDAWVSSHAADHIVKNKNISRKRRRKYRKSMGRRRAG